MKLYKPEEIENGIVKLSKDVSRIQDRIHLLAVSITSAWARNDSEHAHRVGTNQPGYKDEAARLLNLLMNASPYHADAFSKWVAHYFKGALIWNEKDECFVSTTEAKCTPEMLADVRSVPFYKFSPAKKPKPYDDREAFNKWLDTATSKAANAKEEYTLHPGFVRAMREAAAKYDVENAA